MFLCGFRISSKISTHLGYELCNVLANRLGNSYFLTLLYQLEQTEYIQSVFFYIP